MTDADYDYISDENECREKLILNSCVDSDEEQY